MKVSGSLITLRAPEPSDLDALFRHENAPESPDSTTVMAPVSRRMLERYIENYSADIDETGSLRFMIDLTETGETVGSVDIYDFSARDRRRTLPSAWSGVARPFASLRLCFRASRRPPARGGGLGRQRGLPRPFRESRVQDLRPAALVAARRTTFYRCDIISEAQLRLDFLGSRFQKS